jgi:hypothetical protein
MFAGVFVLGAHDSAMKKTKRLSLRHLQIWISATPYTVSLRLMLLHFAVDQALQDAEVTLADAGLQCERQADRLGDDACGMLRTLEIAAVDRVQARARVIQAFHVARERMRLFDAMFIESDIFPALDATLDIPGCFTVTNQPNLSHSLHQSSE